MEEKPTLRVEVSVNMYDVHISRPGHPGLGFDTEDGKELKLALHDMADELYELYVNQK